MNVVARASMTADKLRNLALRPAKPALNRGRVQVRARRALLVLGSASTSQIMEWTHPRGRRRENSRSARRGTIGRPWLWRLRDPE
jgi:hypothetical protein